LSDPFSAAEDAQIRSELLAWNGIIKSQVGGHWREFAMVHTGIHDALNAIRFNFHPYVYAASPGQWEGASPIAAISTVANRILGRYLDDVAAGRLGDSKPKDLAAARAALQQRFDQANQLLAGVDPGAIAKGYDVGVAVTDMMFGLRANDLNATVFPNGTAYPDGDLPGQWRLDYPDLAPEATTWNGARPFALCQVGSDFVDYALPGLDTEQYRNDYNESRCFGRAESLPLPADCAAPLSDENVKTTYVMDVSGTSEAFHLTRLLVAARQLNGAETATLFARVSIAVADAAVGAWTLRASFDNWRPISAIHAGLHGAVSTPAEPGWLSRDPAVPDSPDFPAGNVAIFAAGFSVLAQELTPDGSLADLPDPVTGGQGSITYSADLPLNGQTVHATRTFYTLQDIVDANANSRVWMGHHFRFSTVAGNHYGKQIGAWAATTLPTRRASEQTPQPLISNAYPGARPNVCPP
jgi:hypothetical protein